MFLDFKTFFRDSTITVNNYRRVVDFIRSNRLWDGIFNYRWLSKLLMIAAVVVGLKFLSICISWFVEPDDGTAALSSAPGLFSNLWSEGIGFFTVGGIKYVILILLEVVIFHFTRKTLEIMTGDAIDNSFRAFVKAQIRMIGISVYSFIMESLLSIVAGIALSLLLLGTVKPVVILLIQCYYLGFAIVDNYNEVYNLTLKQSARFTKEYWGVALVTGIFVYVLMLVPLVGIVLGPLTGAVAATITMHQLTNGGETVRWASEE